MGNHYHLLLSEHREGGLTTFLRKMNVGYANYFNARYERSGALFQGRTKKVLIETDAHFLHIPHYLHLNPLDLHPGAELWREYKILRYREALKYLDHYPWSSFLDYCGKRNFPSLIEKDLFTDVLPNYRKAISSYLREMDAAVMREFGRKLE